MRGSYKVTSSTPFHNVLCNLNERQLGNIASVSNVLNNPGPDGGPMADQPPEGF